MSVIRRTISSAALLVALASAPLSAQTAITVTSGADSGPGTLRAALAEAAGTDEAVTIVVLTQEVIAIETPLIYEGTAALTLFGQGQLVSSDRNVTLLTVAQGADLLIRRLRFQGPGGFGIDARGDRDGPAGKGIFVYLRDDQSGVAHVSLIEVSVSNVAGHGIHISDCSLADDCGGGGGGAGNGSDASIAVELIGVEVASVGRGRFDADGLRVDERGPGDIRFSAHASRFAEVGADGVELDEGQAGDVIVRVTASAFEGNGDYCDPELLVGFLPDPEEVEFGQGRMPADAIPGPITGSPDDACFEREIDLYDDGTVEEYAFSIDVDDGFDIDEAGPGDIIAVVEQTGIQLNLDEGLDFDEEDAGDIRVTLVGVTGIDNTDDAFKFSESGAGDLLGALVGLAARGNGGKGAVFEEEDDGDLVVQGDSIATAFNDSGETGIEVVQEDAGEGSLVLTNTRIEDGIEADGVLVTQ